jgi:hypothetical protein
MSACPSRRVDRIVEQYFQGGYFYWAIMFTLDMLESEGLQMDKSTRLLLRPRTIPLSNRSHASRGAQRVRDLRHVLREGLLGAGGFAAFPLRVVLLLLVRGLPGVRLGSARAGTGGERVSGVRDGARNASAFSVREQSPRRGGFRVIGGGRTHLLSCLIFFFSASVSLSFLAAGLGGMVRVRWVGSCE